MRPRASSVHTFSDGGADAFEGGSNIVFNLIRHVVHARANRVERFGDALHGASHVDARAVRDDALQGQRDSAKRVEHRRIARAQDDSLVRVHVRRAQRTAPRARRSPRDW